MLIEFYAITFSVCWISVLCSKSNKRLIMRELASIKSDGWLMVNVKWDINRKCDTIVIWQQCHWLPGSYSLMNTNIITNTMELTLASFHSPSATGELMLGQGNSFICFWQSGSWDCGKLTKLLFWHNSQLELKCKMDNSNLLYNFLTERI